MMKTRFFIAIFFLFLIILAGSVQAVAKSPEKPFSLPSNAERISEDTFKLRPSKDPGTGEIVEAFAIVHKKANFKDAPARAQGSLKNSVSNCYGYLASGAKWKTVESWVVNTANTSSISGNFVFNTLTSDISKWEDATDGVVGNGLGINVLGNGSTTSSALLADTISPDNANEVYFGSIEDPDTIAVTIVWGIFSGPTFQRKLVEWDQIYNSVYSWSSSGEADKMDLDSIIIHELGHSFGMNDLDTSYCSEQTMFGWASLGETKKRTLEVGDINGINKLY